MLSNTCKYAIRAIVYIAVNAKDSEKIGIKKISEDLKIPTPFLGKILQMLAKNKILSSTKGPNGGFGVGKKPDKISLMDIVTIIDGDDNFNSCIIGLQSCSDNKTNCPIHGEYAPIREQAKHLFERMTIAQLAENIKEHGNEIAI
jgi:Rrf2 family protein